MAADLPEPPTADWESLASFAAGLRDLRREAGDPTLAALSARTGISKSVLSVAFSGTSLPTERTVLMLARALGGEESVWRLRREALRPRRPAYGTDEPDGVPGQTEVIPEPSAPESSGRSGREVRLPRGARRRYTLWQLAVVVLIAVALSVAATSLIWNAVGQGAQADADAPQNASGPFFPPSNGADPMRTKCKNDEVIAVDEARDNGQVHMQLIYSNDCLASWGRITRYDGQSYGNTVSMKVWIENDPNGPRTQQRTGKNAQSIYTPMIVEPNPDIRICGEATITAGGKTLVLAPPICG